VSFGSGICGICRRRCRWDDDFCSDECQAAADHLAELEATPAECPLCKDEVWIARTSKGLVHVLERDDERGHIYLEEGFTHVHDDHEHALSHLKRDGIFAHYNGTPPLYDDHYCEGPA
jgi:hypothetical protein